MFTWNSKQPLFLWLFQLEDSKALPKKKGWKSPNIQLKKWLFRVFRHTTFPIILRTPTAGATLAALPPTPETLIFFLRFSAFSFSWRDGPVCVCVLEWYLRFVLNCKLLNYIVVPPKNKKIHLILQTYIYIYIYTYIHIYICTYI